MKRILADQNFNGPILRGLQARILDLDVVRTEDIGLKRFQDTNILTWAANEGRLILTHDARTFIKFAYEHMAQGNFFCGLIVVPASLQKRKAIEDLELIIQAAPDEELLNAVIRLPL